MITLDELKKLDPSGLTQEIEKLSKQLAKIKFEVKNGQSKNGHFISRYKKDIARCKTLLVQHKAAATQNEEPQEETKK